MRFGGLAVIFLALLAACEPPPEKLESFRLSALSYEGLPDWGSGDQSAAIPALLRSCAKLTAAAPKTTSESNISLTAEDWRAPCAAAAAVPAGDPAAARAFFEKWFRPFAVDGPDGPEGLFTGYFEIEIRGARAKNDRFTVPIYGLPDDYVVADLGAFGSTFDGHRLVGRVENGRFVPYHQRGAIDKGALHGRGLELMWIDDPVDVFMLHVQGSGRVILPDGEVVRVGFAGHNGHSYASIGRALINWGELQPNQASWQDIRRWIDQNPNKAAELFAHNPRFVFFRFLDNIPETAGPLGAQGVPLTPGRSLAVDHRFVPYGLPVWLDTVWPGGSDKPLRRLLVAQDTGGAIKGAVRGDFFWGYGAEALKMAGRMKSRGRYYLLLPATAAERLTQS